MHGKGLYSWPDGRKYDGYYIQDHKEGEGTYFWVYLLKQSDGRSFKGQWKHGKQHGYGDYTHLDGSIKSGYWENGKRIKWINEK